MNTYKQLDHTMNGSTNRLSDKQLENNIEPKRIMNMEIGKHLPEEETLRKGTDIKRAFVYKNAIDLFVWQRKNLSNV